ncbi:photosensitized INA-labeled protein 1, PhIL1, putative [Plasmodium relictum]|uniref:Photosensitized INA-labeled protein 1, PhIL1, putative n=1 Tax=Plasmodium relictum TaxID=85471 RepID=A0A1J1HDN8_PLARL|nr:photosensitized INA-labeled protein 1, PhIL1, putative [Plasmodium relictum]CRH03056.1 photosensitized INA-labeled protein 1, PhIL1, putative [Plasmodium relictum]
MLSSILPKRYYFNKQGKIKEIDLLTCKTIISPQKHVDTNNNLTCTTHVLPNIYETSHNPPKMNIAHENNFDNVAMNTGVYINQTPSLNNVNAVPYAADQYNNIKEVNVHEVTQPLNFADGNLYYADGPQGIDPGVLAVSNALFAYNSSFQSIPIKTSPKVFRRRRKGENNSEWSNAFVTRVDPCECTEPEEEYKPYEVTKYYDESGVKTVFNFDHDSFHEAI